MSITLQLNMKRQEPLKAKILKFFTCHSEVYLERSENRDIKKIRPRMNRIG